jgi:hypothetical protein
MQVLLLKKRYALPSQFFTGSIAQFQLFLAKTTVVKLQPEFRQLCPSLPELWYFMQELDRLVIPRISTGCITPHFSTGNSPGGFKT